MAYAIRLLGWSVDNEDELVNYLMNSLDLDDIQVADILDNVPTEIIKLPHRNDALVVIRRLRSLGVRVRLVHHTSKFHFDPDIESHPDSNQCDVPKKPAHKGSISCSRVILASAALVLVFLVGTLFLLELPTTCATSNSQTYTGLTQGRTSPVHNEGVESTGNPYPRSSVDCPSVLQDARYLENLYRKVRNREYRPTPRNCASVTQMIENRFGEGWYESRRVTLAMEAGEDRSQDAARTLRMTCTLIVLDFACLGPRKMGQDYGPRYVEDVSQDFIQFVSDTRSACSTNRRGGRD